MIYEFSSTCYIFVLINFAWNGTLLPDRELKGNNSSYKFRIKFGNLQMVKLCII